MNYNLLCFYETNKLFFTLGGLIFYGENIYFDIYGIESPQRLSRYSSASPLSSFTEKMSLQLTTIYEVRVMDWAQFTYL